MPLLTDKLNLRYVKESESGSKSEILERSESENFETQVLESDILSPTPQPCS